jgi:membrane fusion protein (multidrug efflux system)
MSDTSNQSNSTHALNQIPDKPADAGLSADKKKKLAGGMGALALVVGSYFVYQSFTFVTTDNAQVGARTTLLSARVSGIITKANVEENQKVKAGETLVEIKTDDYQNVMDQLSAEHESMQAQLKAAQSSYKRTQILFAKGASTQEKLDAAEAQYRSIEAKLKSVQAQVSEAKLNVGYTKITAPVDGRVGRKSFEVGMLAVAGQPLLGFVANTERWVTANLKETDMDLIVEGKTATVEVDAISGRTFQGVVESISPATGATFTLLPPDNATGNFTKVVQRVPVRIKLLDLTEHDIDRLQFGLSAEVKIRVR